MSIQPALRWVLLVWTLWTLDLDDSEALGDFHHHFYAESAEERVGLGQTLDCQACACCNCQQQNQHIEGQQDGKEMTTLRPYLISDQRGHSTGASSQWAPDREMLVRSQHLIQAAVSGLDRASNLARFALAEPPYWQGLRPHQFDGGSPFARVALGPKPSWLGVSAGNEHALEVPAVWRKVFARIYRVSLGSRSHDSSVND